MEQDEIVPILKPCPFCGDRPQIVHTGTFTVQCPDCGAIDYPGSQHGACGSQMEQEKGGRFWLTIDVESSRDREWGL